MSERQVEYLSHKIRNYEICGKPDLFTEDRPEDSATEKVKADWEAKRAERIVEHNRCCAEHSVDFSVEAERAVIETAAPW